MRLGAGGAGALFGQGEPIAAGVAQVILADQLDAGGAHFFFRQDGQHQQGEGGGPSQGFCFRGRLGQSQAEVGIIGFLEPTLEQAIFQSSQGAVLLPADLRLGGGLGTIGGAPSLFLYPSHRPRVVA